VHMASAGYYEGAALRTPPQIPVEIDAPALTRTRTFERRAHV
jgi:hypothetical protein